MESATFRPSFDPSECIIVEVPRNYPEQYDDALIDAMEFAQGIYTPVREEPKPFRADFDFENMPLWQFSLLALGVAIAGEVEHKLSFAVIGERNSGKGTIQATATSAFGAGIISSGFSANNLLGIDTTVDEAKKYMFLRDAGEIWSRIVWPNEIRTDTPKGETFIDGNFMRGIASGGDPLTVRGNH
jgi:hypothetical protein